MTTTKYSLARGVLGGNEETSDWEVLAKLRGAVIWAAIYLMDLPDDVALPQIVHVSIPPKIVTLQWRSKKGEPYSVVTLIFSSAVDCALSHGTGDTPVTHDIETFHDLLYKAGFGLPSSKRERTQLGRRALEVG